MAIEKIEVVRSPGTLYGANALAGVINIITRRAQEDTSTSVMYGFGNGQTRIGEAYASGGSGQTQVNLSGRVFRSHIWQPDPKVFNSTKKLNEHENSLDVVNGSISHIWSQKQNSRISFGFSNLNQTPMLMNPGTMMMLGDGRAVSAAAGHKIQFTDDRVLSGNLSFSEYDMVHFAHPGMSDSSVREETTIFNMEQTFRWLKEKDRALVGIELSNKDAESSPNNPADAPSTSSNPGVSQAVLSKNLSSEISWGAYLQNQHPLSQNITLFIGGRFDSHWQSGERASPYASIVWRPTPVSYWRVNSNSSYRFPNIYELFGRFTIARPTRKFTLSGNDQLKPERVTSLETAYGMTWRNRLKTDLSLFHYWIEDPIAVQATAREVFGSGPHTHSVLEGQYMNNSQARNRGGEAILTYVVKDWLQLKGDYAYHSITGGGNLARLASPKSIFHIGPQFGWTSNLNMSIEWEHRSKSTWNVFPDGNDRNNIPAVDLMNLELTLAHRDLSAGFRWDNVWDKENQEFPKGLGRILDSRFLADIKYHF